MNIARVCPITLLIGVIGSGSSIVAAQTVDVIEFYNASQDHYFISSLQPDIDALDSGSFPGWQRTGLTFKAYAQPTGNANPVCRFYIPPAYGDSHFFSASPMECAQTAAKFPYLILESSQAMYIDLPDATTGACPAGDVPIYRVWDDRADSNHRYMTSLAMRVQMIAKGWIAEGYGPNATIMCAPPPAPSPALVLSLDGSTVYDTANNVSWLADGNLAATNRFGLPICTSAGNHASCVNESGSMSYDAATAWIKAMNAASYLGHSNWQLPTTPLTDMSCGKVGPNGGSFGFGCRASAFGSLYYAALGLKAPDTAVRIPSDNVGPFINVQPYLYWSQTSASSPTDCSTAPNGCGYATFSFNTGFQGANTAPNFLYMLPMIAGKIAGTPPASGTALQINPDRQTVYDPMTSVTWLANADIGASNTFGLLLCQDPTTPSMCVDTDGAMSWSAASQIIANMNAYNGTGYLGQTNWQLPTIDPGCSNFNCSGSMNPMGNLFYAQLGLGRGAPAVATPPVGVGPFKHVQPYLYWACQASAIRDTCQADGPATNFAWSFSFGNGFQGTDITANELYATAYFVERQ